MTIKKLALVLAVCLLPTAAFAAGPGKAGKWEMTSQTEMTGVPTKMPPHTFTYCLTKEEAENPEKLVPEQQRRNSDCKRTDFKVEDHTVSWKMTCEKSGTKGDGHVTYSGESYTGGMHIAMPNGGEVNVKFSGKYLGACDK